MFALSRKILEMGDGECSWMGDPNAHFLGAPKGPTERQAEFIDTILSRITLAGAVYLAIIAIVPTFLISGFRVAPIPFVGEWLDAALPSFITQGLGVPFYFGGTSLLIVVGVAMDTVQQIESQLIMRHYDGFMKKTRIRGRRG